MGLVILAVVLALAKGNPYNYVMSLVRRRAEGRPPAGIADVYRALDSEPAPQGVVLASPVTGRMLAVYVADAYPAVYRGSGVISRETRQTLLGKRQMDESDIAKIENMGCRFILLEKSYHLNRPLQKEGEGFDLIYPGKAYSLWKVSIGE
jgi:hypothetical protein